jgi:hypothetical protein
MTSLSIGRTIEIEGLCLTAVERTSVQHQRMERGVILQARKEPYAVLVWRGDGVYAIGMDGAPMSTSELAEMGVWPV